MVDRIPGGGRAARGTTPARLALLEEGLVTFRGVGDSQRVTMLCFCYTIWYTSTLNTN